MFYTWHKKFKPSAVHVPSTKVQKISVLSVALPRASCGTLDKVFYFSGGKVKVYPLDLSVAIFRRVRVD